MTTAEAWEVQIAAVDITGPGVVHRQGDDRVHIPEEIRASIVGLPWEVSFTVRLSNDDDMVPEIAELRITQKKDGEPIGVDLVRSFRLGLARDRAVQQASSRWVLSDDGTKWQLDFAPVAERRARMATQRRSRRVTDDVLRQAAEAYREAKSAGRRDHLVNIAETCHVSRATASRYLARAIDAGLIEEEN